MWRTDNTMSNRKDKKTNNGPKNTTDWKLKGHASRTPQKPGVEHRHSGRVRSKKLLLH